MTVQPTIGDVSCTCVTKAEALTNFFGYQLPFELSMPIVATIGIFISTVIAVYALYNARQYWSIDLIEFNGEILAGELRALVK